MRDTVNVIREGVPAVGLVHEPFKTLAGLAVAQVGMPDAPILAYERDLVDRETEEALRAKAEQIAPIVEKMMLETSKKHGKS